jgi:hypothetical protein
MKDSLLAGLLSAIPLAVVFVIYVLMRGKTLAIYFQGQDASIAHIPEKTLGWIILAGFIGAAFLFGALAGIVYEQLGMPRYQHLALSATILLSVLAAISRQPLTGDKIAWNLVVGLVLGLLVPFVAGNSF